MQVSRSLEATVSLNRTEVMWLAFNAAEHQGAEEDFTLIHHLDLKSMFRLPVHGKDALNGFF